MSKITPCLCSATVAPSVLPGALRSCPGSAALSRQWCTIQSRRTMAYSDYLTIRKRGTQVFDNWWFFNIFFFQIRHSTVDKKLHIAWLIGHYTVLKTSPGTPTPTPVPAGTLTVASSANHTHLSCYTWYRHQQGDPPFSCLLKRY